MNSEKVSYKSDAPCLLSKKYLVEQLQEIIDSSVKCNNNLDAIDKLNLLIKDINEA